MQVLLGAGVVVALALLGAGASAAQAAMPSPAWSIHSVAGPTNFIPGDESGEETYKVFVTNIGSRPTDGSAVTITDTLPSGVKAIGPVEAIEYKSAEKSEFELPEFSCTNGPVQCIYNLGAVPAGDIIEMDVSVAIEPTASAIATNTVNVTGGGATAVTVSTQNPISSVLAPFAVKGFELGSTGVDGAPDTQAGGHPYALTTTFDLNTEKVPNYPAYTGSENVKDVVVDLPLGMVGNALAAPAAR